MPGKTTTETSADQVAPELDVLRAYSQGFLSRQNAIRDLGLRDYTNLLVALGDANLSMPLPSDQEIEEQTATFVKLLQQE
jgi:hypothetical protein